MTTKRITLTPRVKAALSAGGAENLSIILATWPPNELRLLHQELRDSYARAREELDADYIADCKEFDPLLSEAGRALVADRHRDTCAKLAELFIEIEGVIKTCLKELDEEKTA